MNATRDVTIVPHHRRRLPHHQLRDGFHVAEVDVAAGEVPQQVVHGLDADRRELGLRRAAHPPQHAHRVFQARQRPARPGRSGRASRRLGSRRRHRPRTRGAGLLARPRSRWRDGRTGRETGQGAPGPCGPRTRAERRISPLRQRGHDGVQGAVGARVSQCGAQEGVEAARHGAVVEGAPLFLLEDLAQRARGVVGAGAGPAGLGAVGAARGRHQRVRSIAAPSAAGPVCTPITGLQRCTLTGTPGSASRTRPASDSASSGVVP